VLARQVKKLKLIEQGVSSQALVEANIAGCAAKANRAREHRG